MILSVECLASRSYAKEDEGTAEIVWKGLKKSDNFEENPLKYLENLWKSNFICYDYILMNIAIYFWTYLHNMQSLDIIKYEIQNATNRDKG